MKGVEDIPTILASLILVSQLLGPDAETAVLNTQSAAADSAMSQEQIWYAPLPESSSASAIEKLWDELVAEEFSTAIPTPDFPLPLQTGEAS